MAFVQLKHYVENRQAWFDRIIDCHRIPDPYDANNTAKDVAKALPIRLLHGGSYLAWVRDFGLEPRGVESGTGGYWRVWKLARELKAARADTVATVAAAQPEWVRQAFTMNLFIAVWSLKPLVIYGAWSLTSELTLAVNSDTAQPSASCVSRISSTAMS